MEAPPSMANASAPNWDEQATAAAKSGSLQRTTTLKSKGFGNRSANTQVKEDEIDGLLTAGIGAMMNASVSVRRQSTLKKARTLRQQKDQSEKESDLQIMNQLKRGNTLSAQQKLLLKSRLSAKATEHLSKRNGPQWLTKFYTEEE